jgi:hypothetical protein
MKVVVLADDDGEVIAMGHCRMSMNGETGTFTNDAEIRVEIRRSDLDTYRGRKPSAESAVADDLITSVTVELPEELHQMSLTEIQESMVLDRRSPTPRLAPKAT